MASRCVGAVLGCRPGPGIGRSVSTRHSTRGRVSMVEATSGRSPSRVCATYGEFSMDSTTHGSTCRVDDDGGETMMTMNTNTTTTTTTISSEQNVFLDHQHQHHGRAPNRAVVAVCKNKHCCRRGANELYMRLKDEAMGRRDIDIDVRTSGCLKHCKRGPAAHVSVFLEGEEAAREVICVNVASRHDVGDLTEACATMASSS